MHQPATNISLFLICSLLLSFSIEVPTPEELSSAELKEDAFVLRRAMEKYHPGIYWYTPKGEFDMGWDSLDALLLKPMTEDRFFKILLPVVTKVKCAHTFFYPSEKMMASGSRFPLDLKFIGDKVYIMSDSLSKKSIPRGSELITINGKAINDIVNLLLPNLQAQGGNSGWKKVILDNDFQNYYYYLIDRPEIFEIEYLDHTNGQRVSIKVNAVTDDVLRNFWKNWYPKADGSPLRISYHNEKSLAIITVKSFSKGRYRLYNQDFEELIEQYFKEISQRKIQNLIIDVRGNEGGNQPEKLYSYLMKSSVGNHNAYKIKQASNHFDGEVIVLTDERSISAQESFVSIFKYYKRGVTIGRPTPGCAKYLCGGKKHVLVLPHSKFKIQIPMNPEIRINSSDLIYNVGEGYLPDFYVEENLDRDAVMDFALGRIKSIVGD